MLFHSLGVDVDDYSVCTNATEISLDAIQSTLLHSSRL